MQGLSPALLGGMMAANKIKYSGNLDRFCNQKTGTLVFVSQLVAKKIHLQLYTHVGKKINLMSVRQHIHCIYVGDKGVPFSDITSYGGGRFLRLQSLVGQTFEIDYPATEKQTEIELTNQEVKE